MKKQLLTIIALIFSSGIFADGIYNNGGNIKIGTGVTLYVNGNYQNETNVSDGSLDLSGTLKLTGNFTNNVTAADAIGTTATGSKVELIGTTNQIIGGTTSATITFADLTINNSAGVTVSKSVRVTGVFTFISGLVDIESSILTFGPNATVAGTPSFLSMIVATGTAEVRKEFSGIGSFTFPVGDNTISADYSPVSLNFTTGTFDTGAYAGVNLMDEAYADPSVSGSYLSRYWNVTQTGITSFTCDAAFDYQIADVVGTESDIYGVRINPAPFSLFGPANSALHQLTATGLTSFGTFTGAIGEKTLNLTAFLQGLYSGGGLMRKAQGDLGDQFSGTTADQVTVELHNAAPGQYATIDYTAQNINLSTNGLATVNVPANYSGSYYLTVKHRNSIETVSMLPVSFAGSIINYDFSTASTQAFGNNMKDIGGILVIYSGDVNQDGLVDISDLIPVDNLSALASSGYLDEDVNGDALIDISDMIIVDNNSSQAIGTITP